MQQAANPALTLTRTLLPSADESQSVHTERHARLEMPRSGSTPAYHHAADSGEFVCDYLARAITHFRAESVAPRAYCMYDAISASFPF